MKSSYSSPEAWRAQVLRDEVEDLTILVRILENEIGWLDGIQEGRWQGAEGDKPSPLARTNVERGWGDAAQPVDSGA